LKVRLARSIEVGRGAELLLDLGSEARQLVLDCLPVLWPDRSAQLLEERAEPAHDLDR
jgi:hypothetical protein